MLAIQIVTVTWTKASRGGQAAAFRNQIPRAFLLTPHGNSLDVIERRAFSEIEAGDFQANAVRSGQAPTPPSNVDGLLLEEAEGMLILGFSWDGNVHGMPNRGFKRRALVVAPGESAQMRVNGRHSGGAQWYTQHTFNVAYGAKLTENAFLQDRFTHSLSLEENLF